MWDGPTLGGNTRNPLVRPWTALVSTEDSATFQGRSLQSPAKHALTINPALRTGSHSLSARASGSKLSALAAFCC